MPRKYRPPATKRRKAKKPASYAFESAPEPEEETSTELSASTEELDEEDWTREAAVQVEDRGKKQPARHLVKDYSYVQGEVFRILGLAVFLIVALLITALLRS